MIKLLIAVMGLVSATSFARTVEVNPKRTIEIRGVIAANGLDYAEQVAALADSSGEPIHIVINSPGGSVVTGSQILQAMHIAKSRGHEIRCYVPMLAASMGFQVLVHCDKRYALEHALLLFHPMRMGMNGGATADQFLYYGRRLRAWEVPFINDLLAALRISKKTFFYHYNYETMWMGYEFKTLSPGFLQIVDDIKGVKNLFNIGD